jgi:RNase H-like domain found in reverse transcriptase/Integrase zinc binding domain
MLCDRRVLERDEANSRRPVAYFSRTMDPHDQNYHAQEQKLFAIVESLRLWRPNLHGQTFVVQTDHASLQYLTTHEHLTPRQVRWFERFIDFDFKIVHISGKKNLVADALSRSPKDIPSREIKNQAILLDAIQRTTSQQNQITKISLISSMQLTLQSLEILRANYLADPEFTQHFTNPTTLYSLRNGLLHFNEKFCVPLGNIKLSLLHDTHDIPSAGHLGVMKTTARLASTYHWKSLRTTVKDYVKSCDTCQRTKNHNSEPIWSSTAVDASYTQMDKYHHGLHHTVTLNCSCERRLVRCRGPS